MKRVQKAVLFALKEITKWQNLKIILTSALAITLLWLLLAFLFQNLLMSFSAKVLEFIPFSLIRSNGAYMLEGLIWFILVLVSFALIQAFIGTLYLQKETKNKTNTFTFFTLLITAIFWGVVFFFFHHTIYKELLRLITWLPFETVEKSLAFIIAFYIIYNAIIISLLFFASFYSEAFISTIAQKSLNKGKIIQNHTFASIKYTIKDTLIYTLLTIILFPLLFIPILNFFLQVLLWIWLFKDTLSYDAISLLYEKVDKSIIKEHKGAIYTLSFLTILFNFIPVLHIFGAFFGEIAFFYYFYLLKEENGTK